MFHFLKAFKNSKYFTVVALLMFALFLSGCDEKHFDTRAEAEDYLSKHSNTRASDIYVTDDDGNDESLESIQETERRAGGAPIAEGEILKYEDPDTTQVVELFNNGNIYSVFNGGTSSFFTLEKKSRIKILNTYHWNNAQGKTPGTIAIQDASGKTYGPWQAVGALGQGGVPDAYWIIEPDISLEPGTYTVIDSDPATWAQNEGTGGLGMAWATGYVE